MRSRKRLALCQPDDGIRVAVQHQQRRTDPLRVHQRRALVVARRSDVGRPDERLVVVRFETVRRRIEGGEVGDGVENDASRHQVRVQGQQVECREAAGRPADDNRRRGRRPTGGVGMADRGGSVGDVDNAPLLAHRLLVGASMAARAAVVRREDRPPSLQPIAETRQERRLPLIGRAPVEPAQQPAGTIAVSGLGAVEVAVHGATVVTRPLDRLGLAQTGALETEHGTYGDGAPCPRIVDCVRHDLRRGASAGAERDDRVPDPRQLAVHGPSDLVHGACRQIDDDEAPEPRFVPAQRHPSAVGRHGEGALAGAPRRAAVLVRFVEHRSALAVEREPSGGIREVEQRSVPAEARLLHLQRDATRTPSRRQRSCRGGPARSGSRPTPCSGSPTRATPPSCCQGSTPDRCRSRLPWTAGGAGRHPRCGGIERRAPDLGHLHRVGDPPAVRATRPAPAADDRDHPSRRRRRGAGRRRRPAATGLRHAPRRRTRCCPGTSRSTHRRALDRGGVAART